MGKMSGYGQFCPVAKASEVLAERWTPLVLRELLCGSHRFNDLRRGVPLMSRSLLAKRLKVLESAGIVERRQVPGRRNREYHLTPAGEELRPIIEGLGVWGRRWILSEVEPGDLDPSLLMWDIRRSLNEEELPDHQVVLQFDFVDVDERQRRWWLLAGGDQADICMTHPGFEVDLYVESTLGALTGYWVGHHTWRALLADGELRLNGPRWLQRSLSTWLGRSAFAEVPSP